MTNHTVAFEQARTIARLLPSLMRQLLAGDDDLAAELPLAQLRVCGVLSGGPRPMSALGRELGVSLSAMTQIADRLERAQLVNRVTKGSDRRIRCLELTDRGEKLMRLRESARVERVLAALEHLAPKARGEVLESLQVLIRACVVSKGHEAATDPSGDGSPKGGRLLHRVPSRSR
jgi:DNA-binding MarR family transcriptional regulator